MPIIDPATLAGNPRPELVFGLVAPVGTPLDYFSTVLRTVLQEHAYSTHVIRLSEFLRGFNLRTPEPDVSSSAFERFDRLMSRGNELRELLGGGEALALFAAADINTRRPPLSPRSFDGDAFVIRQIKHPDEVLWLRTIYGPAFHLIGISCPEPVRISKLRMDGLVQAEAAKLIDRDRGEESQFGQKMADAFHHSDVFVELRGTDGEGAEEAARQIRRYLALLFGTRIITPTREEYGMFLAAGAALRSADLSRQVGASILTRSGEVISLGCNDVPAPGGGLYWEAGPLPDMRDFVQGQDENAIIKQELAREVIAALTPGWEQMDADAREARIGEGILSLRRARLNDLTEFGRPVHAEMEALLAAGRTGRSPVLCELYTTTFPCHNCAKHILDAGIGRVVYIEPYPKSQAKRLHGDALRFTAEEPEGPPVAKGGRVPFEPFTGVAPRMYPSLFSSMTPEGRRIARKTSSGLVNRNAVGLRVRSSPLSHLDREAAVAFAVQAVVHQHSAQG